MFKNIIFDFDGVLAESLHIKTKAFFEIYLKYGENIADKVVTHHKLNGGMSRFEKFKHYHNYFLKKNISKEEILFLSNEFSNKVLNGVMSCENVKGVEWFLNKHNSKKKWIVSATPTEEIIKIVDNRKWDSIFEGVFGSPEKKTPIVKRIIENNNLDVSETLFLGDAISDYEAAKNNRISFLLRRTEDNFEIYHKLNGVKSFTDFYDLEKKYFNENFTD
jgi:HAD superfamily hydrolase (TIGR01549 family)